MSVFATQLSHFATAQPCCLFAHNVGARTFNPGRENELSHMFDY